MAVPRLIRTALGTRQTEMNVCPCSGEILSVPESLGASACGGGGHKATGPHAQDSSQSHREHKGPRLVPSPPLRGTSRGVPLPLPRWTLGSPLPAALLGLYLVTGRAAGPEQLCVMTAAVEMPVVVEVDEVYQGLATGLAGKASRVPAAPLSCPGC